MFFKTGDKVLLGRKARMWAGTVLSTYKSKAYYARGRQRVKVGRDYWLEGKPPENLGYWEGKEINIFWNNEPKMFKRREEPEKLNFMAKNGKKITCKITKR